jgi:hypothetical protein
MILINTDVNKNLLNGLIINKIIKKIDIAEQLQTVFVLFVKVFKLNVRLNSYTFYIYFYFIKYIYIWQ